MCKAPHSLVVGETVLERDAVRSKEVPYAEQERLPPWTMKDIRWPMAIYISACHLLALAGICMIPSCKTATLLWTAALWPIGGFGITGGAHRLWAHRSYKASFGFRALTMLCNSLANQGTIYHWARDHRTHHFHSETCAGLCTTPAACPNPNPSPSPNRNPNPNPNPNPNRPARRWPRLLLCAHGLALPQEGPEVRLGSGSGSGLR